LPTAAMVSHLGLDQRLHPVDKEKYGARAARMILGTVYQKDLLYGGPRLAQVELKGGKAIVAFAAVGAGLVKVGDKDLAGWSIAGADRQWYPARAEVVGNTVHVSSPKVPEPVAVRLDDGTAVYLKNYLTNDTGIPAEGFRTNDR